MVCREELHVCTLQSCNVRHTGDIKHPAIFKH
uniref:Uncharacterized protein n=1 Tax=Anguilla anguilla TaxID=7936 RepID=A0A0E9VNE7_ANGAN